MASGPADLAPRDLVGPGVALREFRVPAVADIVVVARFEDGGLISYKRTNGTYLHTLNTAEGFARKLQQLGVDLITLGPPSQEIVVRVPE